MEEKKILLGICGGIAAYKMVSVASSLVKKGYSVQVVMTEAGTKFVTPLTFRSITHQAVETDLFTAPQHYNVKHVSLAQSIDLALIAPATANIIGKIANGIADDLLTTIIMATQAPVLIAPSMNDNMYNNPIFKDNLNYLKTKDYHIIPAKQGNLACGSKGQGRLPEPEDLVEQIEQVLSLQDLKGKKVLITAGPTREKIDPVRFLSNYSSGKMGYALAKIAARRGAEVNLISGKVNLEPAVNIKQIMVESAYDMYTQVKKIAASQDIIIMAAAVADYSPKVVSKNKIKKEQDNLNIKLKKNPDILAELGKNKKEGQILIGFAAESENLRENAYKKLKTKNLDMIIANDISKADIGFNSEKNQVCFLTAKTEETSKKLEKIVLAAEIFDKIIPLLKK